MKKYRILAAFIAIFGVSLIGIGGIVSAHSFRTGDNVTVSESEKIDQTLFVAGQSVNISAEVDGDVFCAGQTINITGKVHGDIICAGQTVNVTGEVDGDIRIAGQSITVNSSVSGNATIAGQSFTLGSSGKIGGDVSLGSTDGNFSGLVGRDIAVGGSTIVISSSVGRDIKGEVENLQLTSSAKVAGNIDYTSKNEINRSDGATIGGDVNRTEPQQTSKPKRGAIFGFGIVWFAYWFLAMLVTAMVLVALFPRVFESLGSRGVKNPWKSLLTGFVASIVLPVFLVVLAITVVGLPLAIMTVLLWIVIFLLSGPVFGYFLGKKILKDSRKTLLIMLTGASVLLVLYFIPIIGFLAFLIAYWAGAGMILLELFSRTPRPSYVTETSKSSTAKKKISHKKHTP